MVPCHAGYVFVTLPPMTRVYTSHRHRVTISHSTHDPDTGQEVTIHTGGRVGAYDPGDLFGLSKAILSHALAIPSRPNDRRILKAYRAFVDEVLSTLPADGTWELPEEGVLSWLELQESPPPSPPRPVQAAEPSPSTTTAAESSLGLYGLESPPPSSADSA